MTHGSRQRTGPKPWWTKCKDLVAVHLGAVRVDSQAPDPVVHLLAVGETLALPVRLLGQAASGEVLVSPEVGRLVDGWVALEERPLHLRPGNPLRMGGYAVIGVDIARPRSTAPHRTVRSPFVGRLRELVLLEAVFEQVKVGRGQVVGLVGALGVGKLRLLDEFRQRLTGQRVRYTEGHCLAYGRMTPYLPILDLLREHCGMAVDDPPETLIAKLHASLHFYDPQQHRSHAIRYGLDPGVGRPLLRRPSTVVSGLSGPSTAAERRGAEPGPYMPHPHTLAHALGFAASFYQFRRKTEAVHAHVEALMALSREQEFAQWLAWGAMLRGWVLVEEGQGVEGMAHMRQGLEAFDAIGAALGRPYWLALLGETWEKAGEAEEGLRALAEALEARQTSGERRWEAEIYRLKGQLLLTPGATHDDEAEAGFRQALDIARRQQAKALELRAAMSLSHLWVSREVPYG